MDRLWRTPFRARKEKGPKAEKSKVECSASERHVQCGELHKSAGGPVSSMTGVSKAQSKSARMQKSKAPLRPGLACLVAKEQCFLWLFAASAKDS